VSTRYFIRTCRILILYSAEDVLDLEIEAGGTQFAANDKSKQAFATLIDGDQWMIYRNVISGVLHWDFVRF
jgi:hypothetical protein